MRVCPMWQVQKGVLGQHAHEYETGKVNRQESEMAQDTERKPKTSLADPHGFVLAPLAPEPRRLPLDPRRFGVIEVRFEGGPPAIYRLTVAGQLWSSVEWSPSRRRWCIE